MSLTTENKPKVQESIEWIHTHTQLPDESVTVLLYCPDETEPVWPGYLDELTADGYLWRAADGNELDGVTHWAEMPAGPKVNH